MGRLSLLEHKEERALTGSRVSSGYQGFSYTCLIQNNCSIISLLKRGIHI